MQKILHKRVFYKTNFIINNDEPGFQGYTNGKKWNGYACPYFTYDETVRLLTFWGNQNKKYYNKWVYSGPKDIFYIDDGCGNSDELDKIRSIIIQVGDEKIKTYNFGDHGWCWREKNN